jgi:phosphoenolpyruvate phosphomutase|tara:strand:+ start:4092 stop:5756 length:1665 start_codon:yes stop_codon:yes gene_type:complete
MKKTHLLRKHFNEKKVIRIMGAHNGLSATLVENAGFDGIWASGFEISTSYAVPDANILTMTQYLEAAQVMNLAVSIPIITDCDTGYGNSNNVIHMVRRYEAAGIAAVCIEDKQFPKVNSFVGGRQALASIPEFVGKIMAAVNSREDPDFMIIARIEALINGLGVDEAIKRAHAYVDAGADAILIHSKSKTPDEINKFMSIWDNAAPVVIVPTTYSSIKLKEIEKLGIKMVIYANQGIRASIKAMNKVFSRILKDQSAEHINDDITSMEEVFDLQGMTKMKEEEKKYLRTETEPAQAIILAAGDHGNELSMKVLLEDLPVALLDINGKSILERNIETLNRVGIQDIIVVRGFKKDKINLKNVTYVDNERYRETHILESIACASGKTNSRVLLMYSDIIYEAEIIVKLLSHSGDIVLAIDHLHRLSKFKDNKLDLAVAEKSPINHKRAINLNRTNPIRKIGKRLSLEEANYEFIGISMFSKKGVECLMKEYRSAREKYKTGPFHEAESFEKASLTDILQEMICKGYKVSSMEVNKGWMEIHTFQNYKAACQVYSHL